MGQVSWPKSSRKGIGVYTPTPTVVVYWQTGVQATNSMVTQDTDKDFIQVRPPCWRNTYVLRLIVLDCVS